AADIWKTQDRALRVTMLCGPHTTVYKGVCPATPADVYNPVILVRRRTHRTAFIALHVPGERELDLECLRNEAGTIICQVSGNAAEPDILVKQETATRVEVNGRTYDGLLDFRKGRRTGE